MPLHFNLKNLLVILVCFIILIFLSCYYFLRDTKPEINLSPEILAEFSTYAEKVREEWHVPGMVIAIVENGKIIYAHGFGERNEEGEPVTADTIFDIASLTKSFTAALLAMQIDEGKYAWNTKVTDLYPEFKLYDQRATQEFEVQDLLAHDSGLPESALSALGDFGYSIDHTLYALRFIKPVAPFRTEFSYQNIFPMLAGEIIQKVSGKSFTDNLHQRIFDPLSMKDSYNENEKELYHQKNMAQPFFYNLGHLTAYPINSSYQSKRRTSENASGSSGGIHASAFDVAKWLIFNMNDGAVGKTQLISQKNMNFIHSPQNLITTKNTTKDHTEQYGQGWFIDTQKYPPYKVLYHSGGGMGMHALMAYIPEKKIGIVILTNTWGNKVPEALYQRFFDLCLKNTSKDWSKIYLQEQSTKVGSVIAEPQQTQCQKIKANDLEKYIGTYHNPIFGQIKISKQNYHLQMHIGPIGIMWRLTYCRKNIFQAYWSNPYEMAFEMIPNNQSSVEFIEGKNNTIHKMIIHFLNGDGIGVFVKEH